MSISQQDAIDVMYGIAKATIDAEAPGILGYSPDVRYVGQPKEDRPDQSKLWLRVSSTIVTDGLAAIANANGQQLYEANGILAIEMYCPRNTAGSVDDFGLPLAEAVRTAYRRGDSSGEVLFFDSKIAQMPETDDGYPILVSSKFQYRTVTD